MLPLLQLCHLQHIASSLSLSSCRRGRGWKGTWKVFWARPRRGIQHFYSPLFGRKAATGMNLFVPEAKRSPAVHPGSGRSRFAERVANLCTDPILFIMLAFVPSAVLSMNEKKEMFAEGTLEVNRTLPTCKKITYNLFL